MPILPAEPDFFPPDLWDDPTAVPRTKAEAVWWCLHTKPRQEKATARELRKLGVTFFLPQVLKEDRTPQGRKIRSVIPLFPSYLFLLGDYNDRLERPPRQPPGRRAGGQRSRITGARPAANSEDAQLGPAGTARTGRSRGFQGQDHDRAPDRDRGNRDPARETRSVRGCRPLPGPGSDRGSPGLASRADCRSVPTAVNRSTVLTSRAGRSSSCRLTRESRQAAPETPHSAGRGRHGAKLRLTGILFPIGFVTLVRAGSPDHCPNQLARDQLFIRTGRAFGRKK